MADLEVSAEDRELAGKAAAEIRRRGWVQGSYGQPEADDDAEDPYWQDCQVCIVGSVAAAAQLRIQEVENRTGHPLLREIRRRVGYMPVEWNDEFGRTEGEVLALLDSIAAGQ